MERTRLSREGSQKEEVALIHSRRRRRSSIAAAGTSLELTPEIRAIERSACYADFAKSRTLAKTRRNSLTGNVTKEDSETKLRNSLVFLREYQSTGQSKSIEKLKERFQRRGSLKGGSRSSNSERASVRSPKTGSVVVSVFGTDSDHSMDLTVPSAADKESISIPVTEIHQKTERIRKEDLEREYLIESLVNFSYHTPSAVLEDLIAHELRLWGKSNLNELHSNDDESDGSFSSLSDDENGDNDRLPDDTGQSRSSNEDRLFRISNNRPSLPKSGKRKSALLFVDISGFTKLSTMLDVEYLSKVINSYFEMICHQVHSHGGDILKFAGDAFFAEWRVQEVDNDDDDNFEFRSHSDSSKGLQQLNQSLFSSQEFCYRYDNSTVSACVSQAAKCAASIVEKLSDYHVSVPTNSAFTGDNAVAREAMLNVHCGIGCGDIIGLHVGDYQEGAEGQEDNAVELRREFLFLGDPINQASWAANVASGGEVVVSPEALWSLHKCCGVPVEMAKSSEPKCIAARTQLFISFEPKEALPVSLLQNKEAKMSVNENLRFYCKHLHRSALSRLHLQVALYVHPVVRGDELAFSKGATTMPKLDTPESRHLAEAELRLVYTMFIKVLISPKVAGDLQADAPLFKILGNVMHVTSRELDRYSGQLRQFIVDDKGVVLIATFGLRGSTFPNMVANNALPATFDIHKALNEELGVENRIGATFGQVYCGVVGSTQRHEFSVLGAAVNLAARLMESPINTGLLVDEAVKSQADARYSFRSLQPVKAKGYDKPVAIFEPLHAISSGRKKGNTSTKFVGRQRERNEIVGFACEILDNPEVANSSVINVLGESGIGKSALGDAVMREVKVQCQRRKKRVLNLRSTSTENEQRIPLCAFRKVLLTAIRELCTHDGSVSFADKAETSRQALLQRYTSDIDLEKRKTASPFSGKSYDKQQQWRSNQRQLSLQDLRKGPKVQKLEQRGSSNKSFLKPGGLSGWGSFSQLNQGDQQHASRDNLTSLPRPVPSVTLKRGTSDGMISLARSLGLEVGKRGFSRAPLLDRENGLESTTEVRVQIPYMKKLYWVCEEVGYPREYANLVGSQFLGLESTRPVTHIDGHVPLAVELVEFVAQAFMRITDFADIILVFIDDFQWVDSFTWKVIRALGQSGKKMLLVCAMRSHDKQAMRRMSTFVNFRLEITLGPMDLPEIKKLITNSFSYSQDAIDEYLCTDVYQRTGGIPVFVIELLETVKRNKMISENEDGKVRLTNNEQLVDKGEGNNALMESLLNRFDALDVRVRKILQTCAVLGNSFALSDLIRVHPEKIEKEVEHALEIATEEMILVEISNDDEDSKSLVSTSTGGSDSLRGSSIEYTKTSSGLNVSGDRSFKFSHDMWRNNVLTTMLKERKIELHRQIAETMEKDQALILRQSDIARLLTLFDHWKSCGDFNKAAPLAIAVGTRLNEWGLAAQSLDLYRDALDMCFECVEPVDERFWRSDDDWIQVVSKPRVLDLALRLHIEIAECHRIIGDLHMCLNTLQDAYMILNSSTCKIQPMKIPILAKLCFFRLALDPYDDQKLREQETLIQQFVQAAQDEGNGVHLARALSMEAAFFAQQRNLERAIQDSQVLQMVYRTKRHSSRMIELYEKDYAMECFSQSILWYFLVGEENKAARQADLVLERYLPHQDPEDIDSIMALILPAVLILKSVGRAVDADYVFKKYVVNAYHDKAPSATYWVEMFNPLCYLLEIVKMEDGGKFDIQLLDEIQGWILDEVNTYFSPEHLRLGHTIMGEMCWRLGHLKQVDDPMRPTLFQKSRWFLIPIARDTDSEPFLAHSALTFLKAM